MYKMYKPKYFKATEFYNYSKMNSILILILDKLREKCGDFYKISFQIISSNEETHKHSSGSLHYLNKAVDFVVNVQDHKDIIFTNKFIADLIIFNLQALKFWDNIGIGIYVNSKGIMSIHLDYREKHGEWMAISKDETGNWIYEGLDLKKIEKSIKTNND